MAETAGSNFGLYVSYSNFKNETQRIGGTFVGSYSDYVYFDGIRGNQTLHCLLQINRFGFYLIFF